MPGLLQDNRSTQVPWSHRVKTPCLRLAQSRELSLGHSNERVNLCPLHCRTGPAYIVDYGGTCCIVEWIETPYECALICAGNRAMAVVQRLVRFGHHQSRFLQVESSSRRQSVAPPPAQEYHMVESYERRWIKCGKGLLHSLR